MALSAFDDLEDEKLVLGEYDLEEEIGRGAMGAVYRARHRKLGREVALKVVLSGKFASASERRRFLVEAEAAAQLDHPHLVAIHELGEADGRLFYAMQLVEGATLSDRIAQSPLPPREAAALLQKIALAVEHAHQRGVLHRDLKPANILLDSQGEPHVADFGLARRLDRETTLTLAGGLLGTPAYMAPETISGAEATIATDVWSLGAILYETLAQLPPFPASSLPETLRDIVETEPAPLRECVPTMNPDLEAIVGCCLEKQPGRRYPTAGALAADLDRWLQGKPVEARRVSSLERFGKWARRHPAIAILSAVAVLFLAGGATATFWQWRQAVNHAARAEKARVAAEASALSARRALYAADMNLCSAALRANNLGRARRLLDAHRPRAGEPDLRGGSGATCGCNARTIPSPPSARVHGKSPGSLSRRTAAPFGGPTTAAHCTTSRGWVMGSSRRSSCSRAEPAALLRCPAMGDSSSLPARRIIGKSFIGRTAPACA